MSLFGFRSGLIAVLFLAFLIAGCGSTNRAAPIEDRTRTSAKTPPVESRTVDTSPAERNTKPQPVATQATRTQSAPATTAQIETIQSAPAAPEPTKNNAQPAPTRTTARTAVAASDENDWRPDYYTVRKGDTLYSIALDFGQDYRDVAAWNNLANAAYIQIGQRLRVSAPEGATGSGGDGPPVLPAATLPSSEVAQAMKDVPTFTDPMTYRSAYSQQAYDDLQRRLTGEVETTVIGATPAPAKSTPAAKPAAKPVSPTVSQSVAASPGTPDERLRWEWPAPGKLLYSFDKGPNKKGLAIQGQPDQPVVSSAPGKVVYSGSGLRGYGNLIIVKHNATYLSVYAHNSQVLVSEGQMVAQGQKIGVMGEISPGQTALHFEIRRLGKPIDPLALLPDRAS